MTTSEKIAFFIFMVFIWGFCWIYLLTENLILSLIVFTLLLFSPVGYKIVKWYIIYHHGVDIDTIRWELQNANPYEFEQKVADMYKRLGYHSTVTSKSRDYGADVIMKRKGIKYVIQVKKYGEDNKIGRPDLQRLQGAAQHYHAIGMKFVTYGFFSSAAVRYAKQQGIEIIDYDELIKLMCRSYRKLKE